MKDLGLLALRLAFGGLIAVHGYPKLFGGKGKAVSPDAERLLGAGFTQSVQNGGPDQPHRDSEEVGVTCAGSAGHPLRRD